MAFSKSRILSAKRLSKLIKEATENGEQRFCFILGSGASVESGIPSGSSLEMQWMDCLMGRSGDRGMPAMEEEETRRLASDLYIEGEMKHEFSEIEAAWKRAKQEGRAISSEYYFDIYRLRFHANPRKGYSYLEKIMERCDPSLGYHTLAKLLTENNQNNLVITTNFDSLVEDALFLYTDKKPLVVSHESLAGYMDANIQRPIVAKVHRGLMYAPFNSPDTTNELKAEWQAALNRVFDIYTPIVIGYAGGDHSLMSFLEDEHTDMRKGVYWCYRGKPDPSDLPEEKIQRFVEKRNGFFVAIDGFDALMVEIGKVMYGDAIRPGLTTEYLRKRYDKRAQQYNQQWEELNQKPEMQEALQEMNKAERREEKQREKNRKLTVSDYIRRGNRARNEGRRQDAMDEYSKAIELYPENAGAYIGRGNIYSDLGNSEEALKNYDKAIELDPNYAKAYHNRGTIYDKSGHLKEAFKDYDKAIELNPNYVKAYYNRGNVYYNLGQYEEALKDYDKIIELNPNNAQTYYNRGNVHYNLSQYEEALKDYDKAIELDPNYVKAYYNRSRLYIKSCQPEKALKDYDKIIELDSNYVDAYYNRGILYRKSGQSEKALKDYDKAIELDSNYTEVYYNRGNLYADLGQYKEALKDYTQAIELDSNRVNAYNNRGTVYEILKKYEKAIEDYTRAIQLNPKLKAAYQNRARAYSIIGEKALAEADRKKAEEI